MSRSSARVESGVFFYKLQNVVFSEDLSHPVLGLRPLSAITIREDHIQNHTTKLLNLVLTQYLRNLITSERILILTMLCHVGRFNFRSRKIISTPRGPA